LDKFTIPSVPDLGWQFLTTTPVVTQQSDGTLQLFVLASGTSSDNSWLPNQLLSISQTSPSGNWSDGWVWQTSATNELTTIPIGGLALAQQSDGRLQLFVVGSDYKVYSTYQTSPSGSYSLWA